MKKYDAIIISAGQAGVPLARKLAEAGWKTALVERRFIGGTCINDGCTPTKTMIASGKMACHAGKSDHWGVEVESYRVNMPAVKRRKDEVVASFREGAQKRLQMTDGLKLIFGEAKFTGPKKVKVCLSEGGKPK